jgi:hypothetical protein
LRPPLHRKATLEVVDTPNVDADTESAIGRPKKCSMSSVRLPFFREILGPDIVTHWPPWTQGAVLLTQID